MHGLLENSLYLLALINPVSKVFILSMLPETESRREVARISIRSTLIGLLILVTLAGVGNYLLGYVFHVEIYSLRVAGGLVLLWFGFTALTKGVFFEVSENQQLHDISVVPLASPLIAGPATITAAISFSADYGFRITCLSLVFAVAATLAIMLSSRLVGRSLNSHNLMSPLIRITGLIVCTIAVQMVLSGLGAWWHDVR